MKPSLSSSRLHELFSYEDGNLISKVKIKSRNIGDKVGTVGAKGYLVVRVDGTPYLLHRVVYAMHHGHLPKFIDHIDCDILNNRIENLREATNGQNQWNQKISARNTSGVKGVYFDKNRGKWRAMCRVNKKKLTVGSFERIEDAAKAIAAFRKEQHQEYARNA